jgi:putative ABC transport system permease protein
VNAKFLLRDLKSGELSILIVTLVLAIMCVSSVLFMTEGIKKGLDTSGEILLGGDRVLSSPTQIDKSFIEKAQTMGIQTSETISFLSMLVHGNELALASIKAVEESYPLKGNLAGSTTLLGEGALLSVPPAPGTIWLESDLFALLNVKLQDIITIGSADFKIEKVLTLDPMRGGEEWITAPRALINKKDVARTAVIQLGSRQTYRVLMSGNKQAMESYEQWVLSSLKPSQTWADPKKVKPLIANVLEEGQYYLSLILMLTVVLASVAISQAARRFAIRQINTVAILRCFGARFDWILMRFILEISFLALLGGFVGYCLGFLIALLGKPFVIKILHQPILWEWKIPLIVSFLIVLALLSLFALPPLWALRSITPLNIMRGTPSVWKQAPSKLMQRLRNFLISSVGSLGIGIRYGIANFVRTPLQTSIQILAFSLVMLCAWLLFLVKTDLLQTWQKQVPKNAPNYFAINIEPTDVQDFQDVLTQKSIHTTAIYPIVRGRLEKVNNDPVVMDGEANKEGTRHLYRLLNLSYTLNLPEDNRIVQGTWFSKQDIGKQKIAIEQEFAKRMNIKMHDQLTFQIGEKSIQAEVSIIRTVRWDSFNPNFFILFPPGVIDEFPKTYITSFYLPSQELPFLRTMIRQFPDINLINTTMILKQFGDIVQTLTWVIHYLWIFMMMMALMLLWCSVIINRDERQRHAALFRALGASNQSVMGIMLSEFCLLGFSSGLIAVIGANIVFAWVVTDVFNLSYQLNTTVLAAGPVLGIVLVSLAGWLGSREILSTPPARLLSAG